jgi:hypothetical protein
VSLFGDYANLVDTERFQNALKDLYNDVYRFLVKARQIFKKSSVCFRHIFLKHAEWPGFIILVKGIWKTYESEFHNILSTLPRRLNTLQDETTLARHKELHTYMKEQRERSRTTEVRLHWLIVTIY